jgi:hypothetical protein
MLIRFIVVAALAAVVIGAASAAPPAPKATIKSGPSGAVASTTATFTFSSNTKGATFQCKLDTASSAGCGSPKSYSGLAEGSHTFSVQAVASGTVGPAATATWKVDTTPPAVPSITGAPNDPSNSSTATFTFSDTEPGVSFRCAVDGAAAVGCASPYTRTSLTNGVHTFSVAARDAAGNQSGTASSTWHIDTTPPPTPTFDSQQFDSAYANGSIAFSDAETAAQFKCAVDGGPFSSCSSPQSLGPLAPGQHSFSVEALDALANTSAATSTSWLTSSPSGTTQWFTNGNFESGTAGWGATNGVLTLASDGNTGGTAAKVTQSGTPQEYWLFATPRPVSSTVAGTTYTVTGYVRSDRPGKQVCTRMREYTDSTSTTKVGEVTSCVTTTTAWQTFSPLVYTAAGSGHTIAFQVYQVASTVAAGDSFEVDGLSMTSPQQGTSNDPVIAAAGDVACTPSDPNFNGGAGTGTFCMQRATGQLLASMASSLSAILPLGDEQYQCGELANFNAVYDAVWGGALKALEHPVPGNHEYGDTAACTPSNASGYYSYFGSAAGDPKKGYYSYDIGSWHLVALNSECAAVGGCTSGSPQEMWLRNDLATHANTCTLAYWHHPRWSSGQTGDDPRTAQLWNDLVAAHAELVLSGHDHTYQRYTPMDANGNASPTGVREVVSGTGGEEHHILPLARSTLQVFDHSTFGILKLTLGATSYGGQFIPAPGTGSFTDSFSGTCS